MRLEHPWYSKYWAPKPYNKTPSEATHTTPPSGRQPHSDQGFLGRETAQQQHAAPVPLGSPHGISNVGRPSTSPEYLRGPPPGFPSPVCQPQAGWQPSPPRMQPQPMGVNGIDLGYHGPPHQQPSVPFHHQMAQIPQQPQTYGGLPPAHQFNQGFQPYGPPQWHHGPPPHWHYPHPHPPPPPPPPPPPGLYGPIDFADPIPQPPYQVPPPFNHHGGPYGHAQPHVNPQVQGPRVTNGGYLEQGPPKTESLPHSSSSSGEESARILFELLRGKARAVQATTTEGFNKASSGESASPDKPSTPSDNASTLEGQHVVDASEKSSQEGERSYQGGTVVRHAQFSIQDVRFDQNMSGTVRIRPNRRNQHQALPTEWLSGTGNRCATPVEQAAPSGPKKGKNKKKAGTRSSSRPSTPVNFCPNQPESSKATASVPTEQTESVNEKAALQVPGPKGYRADAGGSLKMSRNRKGPAIRVSQLTEQMLPPPLSNGSLEAGPSAGPVANGINTKQARFQRFDSLSSMPDCPVLPRASDLFPNYPDLSTSPPKIVMTPAEITPVEEAISLSEANLTNGLDGGTHRVSDSSRCQSFYTAKSTLSSRENSPPEAAKDEVFVSPPETPTKQQTASQVSSRTLSAHPSPVAAPAAPVSDSPIATPTLDTDNNNDMSQPEPAEPAVPNFETPPPEPSRPKSKKKNKKKNKAKANIAADPSSATDPSSSQPPEKQQQQQPTPIISNPNSRPATPASDGSSANIRNQKKRKAHARTKAEKKRSAATATTTTTTSAENRTPSSFN
ncbi:hypothetical protein QBC41DRAFT_270300 [Cercophora samala]|uniref:Uncharacterized protein n=1 Tax=Cercophora samala TaxID=330535 RepID=A0AA39ZHW9_9PEZI|nr:hypothetical protein QBC41DRAFT_270300 [Cercophora samala]